MNFFLGLLSVSSILALTCGSASAEKTIVWHDAKTLTVEGRGWDKEEPFYGRYPERAQASLAKANKSLEWLSKNTTGMAVRFETDASDIVIRWNLISSDLTAGFNMFSATGVSGVDLYTKYRGKWRWAGTGVPTGEKNEAHIIWGVAAKDREFMLYLPLYNGVSSVEIGVNEGATIKPLVRPVGQKPILFYGSSITHGGCTDRAGMTFPSIIGRRLDVPVLNLGYAGNGNCEHPVTDLIAELDPRMYIIDTTNVDAKDLDERLRYMLDAFKSKHPGVPVLLLQNIVFQSRFLYGELGLTEKDLIINKILEDYQPKWQGGMYFLDRTKLLGADGDATVDGIHPTSLGEVRMAEAIIPVIRKAIK